MAEFLQVDEVRNYPLSTGETADLVALAELGTGAPGNWIKAVSLKRLPVGAEVYVTALGEMRRGVVVATTRTRVRIALTTISAVAVGEVSGTVRVQTVVADPNYVLVAPSAEETRTALSWDAYTAPEQMAERQVVADLRQKFTGILTEELVGKTITLPTVGQMITLDQLSRDSVSPAPVVTSPDEPDLIGCPECEETMEVSTEDADATLSEMYRHIFSRHADADQARTYELLAKVREMKSAPRPTMSDGVRRRPAASGAAVVGTLEKIWERIRVEHPELPKVVIVTGSGMAGDNKWGHFRPDGWTAGAERVHEMFVAGETLAKGPAQVLQTMLHEAAHCLARIRSVKDTARQGRYHNGRFRKMAEELGLQYLGEKADRMIGFSAVVLTEDTSGRYADLLAELSREIDTVVPLPGWLGGQGVEGGEKIPVNPRPAPASSSTNLKLICACEEPTIIRASRKVAGQSNVTCGTCRLVFTEPRECCQTNGWANHRADCEKDRADKERLKALAMRDHPFSGDGEYCDAWLTGRSQGDPEKTGTVTMSVGCGYPRDAHPAVS